MLGVLSYDNSNRKGTSVHQVTLSAGADFFCLPTPARD